MSVADDNKNALALADLRRRLDAAEERLKTAQSQSVRLAASTAGIVHGGVTGKKVIELQ